MKLVMKMLWNSFASRLGKARTEPPIVRANCHPYTSGVMAVTAAAAHLPRGGVTATANRRGDSPPGTAGRMLVRLAHERERDGRVRSLPASPKIDWSPAACPRHGRQEPLDDATDQEDDEVSAKIRRNSVLRFSAATWTVRHISDDSSGLSA